jgi:hypothetical protein
MWRVSVGCCESAHKKLPKGNALDSLQADSFTYIRTFYWQPLWSIGQSSLLKIQRSGFHSGIYQILLEAVGLERGPLSLVRIIEELLEWKVAAPV